MIAARSASGPYQIANLHVDNFYCFRCWEIRSLGVSEEIIIILQVS